MDISMNGLKTMVASHILNTDTQLRHRLHSIQNAHTTTSTKALSSTEPILSDPKELIGNVPAARYSDSNCFGITVSPGLLSI